MSSPLSSYPIFATDSSLAPKKTVLRCPDPVEGEGYYQAPLRVALCWSLVTQKRLFYGRMIEIRFSSEAMRACSTLKNLLDPKQTRKRLQLRRVLLGGDQQRDCRRSNEKASFVKEDSEDSEDPKQKIMSGNDFYTFVCLRWFFIVNHH